MHKQRIAMMIQRFTTVRSSSKIVAMQPQRDAAPIDLNRVDVGNALSILRPTLGDKAGVALYRLLPAAVQARMAELNGTA